MSKGTPVLNSNVTVNFVESPYVKHAGRVAQVNDDGTFNVGALDSEGKTYSAVNLPLVEDGATLPEAGLYITFAATV